MEVVVQSTSNLLVLSVESSAVCWFVIVFVIEPEMNKTFVRGNKVHACCSANGKSNSQKCADESQSNDQKHALF